MIVEKLMMPYYLVSHHTIVHATLLILYLSVLLIDSDNDCENSPEDKKKSCEVLNRTYYYMIGMHAGCFFLHSLIKYSEIRPFINMMENNMYDFSKKIYQSAFFPKFLLTVKIFLYFGSITIAQIEIFRRYFPS